MVERGDAESISSKYNVKRSALTQKMHNNKSYERLRKLQEDDMTAHTQYLRNPSNKKLKTLNDVAKKNLDDFMQSDEYRYFSDYYTKAKRKIDNEQLDEIVEYVADYLGINPKSKGFRKAVKDSYWD